MTITIGGETKVFELIRSTSNPSSGNIPVVFTNGEQPDSIASKLLDAIRANFDVIDEAVLPSFDASGTALTLTAIDDEDGVAVRTFNSGGESFLVFVDPATPEGQIITSDDVVGFLNPLDPAGTQVPVQVTGSGLLDIWVDYDQNASFDPDEHVVISEPVVGGLRNVTIVSEPIGSDGEHWQTWMRVRLSPSGGLTPTGVAVGGEVEDYLVSVIPRELPVPNPDMYDVNEDTTLVINSVSVQPDLLDNDDNTDDQLLDTRFFVGEFPTNGTLIVDDEVEGYFTYIPDPDFYGTDTFTYRLSTQQNSGSSAALSTFATVTINVHPVNDTPGFADGTQPKSFVGLEVNSRQTQSLEIDPADLLIGSLGHANPAIPSAPWDESSQIATMRVISVTAGGLTISQANASDVATTAYGELRAEFDMAGTVTNVIYTPNTDFNSDNLPLMDGSPRLDDFTYTIQDDGLLEPVVPGPSTVGTRLTATGTATIRVAPQNNPPTPISETLSIDDVAYTTYFVNLGLTVPVPTEDVELPIPGAFLRQNDFAGSVAAADENTSIRGNDGALQIVGASIDPSQGTIELLSTGDLLLTPADDVYGQITFQYVVEDQGIDEAVDGTRVEVALQSTVTSTVFLEPVNDPPVAFDRFLTVTEAVEPAGPAVLSFTAADLLVGAGPNASSPIMVSGNQVTLPDGAALIDGETMTMTDTSGLRRVVEFSTSTTPSVGTDLLVTYTDAETADVIAARLESLLRNDGAGGIVNGATVSFIDVTSINPSTFASTISATALGVSIPDGATIISGETVTTTDAQGNDFVIEFNTTGVSRGGADVVIQYATTDDSQTIALMLQTELINRGYGAMEMAGVGNRWMINFSELTVAGINDPMSMIGVAGDVLTMPDGGNVINGETINLSTGQGNQIVVEFNTTGVPTAGTDLLVTYTLADTADQVATNFQDALRSLGFGAIADLDTVTLTSIASAISTPPVTQVTTTPTAINIPDGIELIDGETVDIVTPTGTAVVEFNTTGLASPGTDYVVRYTTADSGAALTQILRDLLRADGYGVTDESNVLVFSNSDTIVPGELPAIPGDFDDSLPSPFNESEQTPQLRVVAFSTSVGTVDVATVGNGTTTLATAVGGTLSLTFAAGGFVSGTYTPPVDYNEEEPFVPRDLFTYTISDDGRTTLPTSMTVEDLADERSLQPATVTITVLAANDPPTFDSPDTLDILEDSHGITVDNVITNALPGPPTASDEIDPDPMKGQQVTFSILAENVPAGLMEG